MSFRSFPSFLWWLPSVVGLFNASCWDGTFSEELCCEPVETEGKASCWNELYKFEDCCPTWQFSGAYIGVQKHIYDKGLGSALVPFFQSRRARSILDLGAGAGWYVQTLRKASLRAGCFDGNRAVREVSQGRCLQADLSEEHDLGQRWDWVMSIEVAEHVPYNIIFWSYVGTRIWFCWGKRFPFPWRKRWIWLTFGQNESPSKTTKVSLWQHTGHCSSKGKKWLATHMALS